MRIAKARFENDALLGPFKAIRLEASAQYVSSLQGVHFMEYQIAPLFCRPWTLNGMSPRLIESHYEHNYGEALNRLNAITKELESLDAATTPVDVINRLKRDQFTELNSTLLHELYFASLGGDGRTPPEIIAGAITRDFGFG
jgi:Fe-Mn family superoxide dismutase